MTISTSLFAGRVPLPPVEDAYKSRNIIAVFQVDERLSEDTIRVKRTESLWGEADQEFTLKLPAYDLPNLEVGQSYVMAYSKLSRHPFYRDEFQTNPQGPTVVRLPYVGVAAFEDSNLLRQVFQKFQSPLANDSTQIGIFKRIDMLFALIDEFKDKSESATLRLALIEMSQHHQWLVSANHQQFNRYQKLVESRQFNDELQEHLVAAVDFFPADRRGEWIAAHCRKVIAETGSVYELTSNRPLLVRSCVKHMSVDGNASDSDQLGGLLKSNAPGVVKAAVDALNRLAPDQIPLYAQTALEHSDAMHSEIRRILSALVE